MTKILQHSQTQCCRRELGFRPQMHRMIWGSIRGSHKLRSLGILCMLPRTCFYVVSVNKFPIRGCKGESDNSFLHNIIWPHVRLKSADCARLSPSNSIKTLAPLYLTGLLQHINIPSCTLRSSSSIQLTLTCPPWGLKHSASQPPPLEFSTTAHEALWGGVLSQLSLGERQGTPCTGRQSNTGPHRDTQPFTLILETPINQTCMFLGGGKHK